MKLDKVCRKSPLLTRLNFSSTVSNYLGNSKNHHVIRPRNVDQNKRLLVSNDKEDFSAEMRIPRCSAIEVPIIEELASRKNAKKSFKRPSHYLRYSLLPNEQLENLIDYELTEADLEWAESNRVPKVLNSNAVLGLLEQAFVVWENDTNKGQIIPWERAWYLVKEEKVVDEGVNEEVTRYIEAIFKHWVEQRRVVGRPLIRRFWKSEGVSDSQIKIAFQARTNKEKRRLRNSKKNDQEILDKMKALVKHFEVLQTLFKGVHLRESLKKNKIEYQRAAFEQERSEKGLKNTQLVLVEENLIDPSKEFRKIHSFVDPVIPPIQPEIVHYALNSERIDLEKPLKRSRPEVSVVRKKELNHEIARACCFLIAEGEKLQKWPFIDGNNKTQNETKASNSGNNQVGNERSLKMRGRISRIGKKIVIDRLSNNEYEHRWGRYLGLRGVWHCFDGENLQDEFENDDTEAMIRVQKLIFQNFKPNGIKIKK